MDPTVFILAALPVILAITLHEAAHGYVARHFGDPTAWQAGRITANPLKHIDPVGTILVPAIILLLSTGGILFGWAKPVPVNFGRLHHPKRDMLWVAAAGPAANLAMLLFWAALMKLALLQTHSFFSLPMQVMAHYGMGVNIALMVLNLFPLPPLDGGRIAVSLLPPEAAWRFAQVERFGFPILLLLLFTGVLSSLLTPVMRVLEALIEILFQLPS
ncbi:MAG: Zn-dependent protease [Candidatus Accumulibacter phosphatis]|uniref:Zn-dependent protease n=1 Tax=Candidatus Accumulibacter phosphatis TaxID=327160 RepID=A0A084Y6S1_9PROT|nr:site-2 protease family protein [Accumulibacter sp.]KFB70415.1 MAG: Zn-dependent protease [Candidatus Accumulibacter phosphatis]MBL8406871.1 site-2 protease family protein [Accumulibacter sp.]